jgi:hypothetical protein
MDIEIRRGYGILLVTRLACLLGGYREPAGATLLKAEREARPKVTPQCRDGTWKGEQAWVRWQGRVIAAYWCRRFLGMGPGESMAWMASRRGEYDAGWYRHRAAFVHAIRRSV